MLSLGAVDMHKILRTEVRRYEDMEVWTHIIVLLINIFLGKDSFSHRLEDGPDSQYG